MTPLFSSSASSFLPLVSPVSVSPTLTPTQLNNNVHSYLFSGRATRPKVVTTFISDLCSKQVFSIGGLTRSLHRLWKERQPHESLKPSCRSAKEMFRPDMFRHGLSPVPSSLRCDRLIHFHSLTCDLCSHDTIHPTCYFNDMLACAQCGWFPSFNISKITPQYSNRNSRKISLFKVQTTAEFQSMIDNKVLAPASSVARLIHPLGVVIKNSDLHRARALANISIIDSASLASASQILVALGGSKVKCRITTDCTATGLNRASLSPSFDYMTLSEGLRIISRNDFLGKGDITRYFFCFPLAQEARKWFCVRWNRQVFEYQRLMFGHTACPYFCSTWSAEFYSWFRHASIDSSFIMDDWLVSASSRPAAVAKMDTISSILSDVGIGMAEDKYGFGQQLTFIGVLIDTVTMTIRIDSAQAAAFLLQLRQYLRDLHHHNAISEPHLRHLAGKLNWYSEVCQGGRIHIHALWRCLTPFCSPISSDNMSLLLTDLRWWELKLMDWSADKPTSADFRLFSGSEILANKHLVYIVQSDASGTDGFGYLYHTLEDDQYFQWVSRSWPVDFTPSHSHHAELLALLDFLRSFPNLYGLGLLLIWVSDCEAACWSVNKGNCKDPISFLTLSQIFDILDVHRFQILALWIPREENQYADHLSHLSSILYRSSVEGIDHFAH